MEKQREKGFAYCLVDNVKHHENDVERHEVSRVYWRRMQIKVAFLDENTWGFQHWLGNKTVISWLFGGIDKTTAPRYRGQLDAPLPSASRPRAIVHRAVHGTSGQQFWLFPKLAFNNCILSHAQHWCAYRLNLWDVLLQWRHWNTYFVALKCL